MIGISLGVAQAQFLHALHAGLIKEVIEVGDEYNVERAYLLAICSRETGIRNVAGDGGHGRGVMQVDDRSHPICDELDFEQFPVAFIREGMKELSGNIAHVKATYPNLNEYQVLKFAAAGYNCGMGTAEKAHVHGNCDAYTAHHNYGSDVMARRETFQRVLDMASIKAQLEQMFPAPVGAE